MPLTSLGNQVQLSIDYNRYTDHIDADQEIILNTIGTHVKPIAALHGAGMECIGVITFTQQKKNSPSRPEQTEINIFVLGLLQQFQWCLLHGNTVTVCGSYRDILNMNTV